MSAIPFVVAYIIGVGGGQLADWLRYSKILTTGEVRKVFGTAGEFEVFTNIHQCGSACISLNNIHEKITRF